MVRSGFYFVCSVFVICFLLSCGGEERDLLTLSPAIKEWASFKEGSYWIFSNDSTGSLDSLFVGYNGTEVYPSADGTHDVEGVNTTLTSSNNDLLGFIFGIGLKEVAFQDSGIEIEYSCAAGFNIENSFIKEEKILKGYYAWSVERVSDQVINGITYTDVIFIEVKHLDIEGEFIEGMVNKYWISNHNWIIKKTYTEDGKTYSWSLLRNYIIQ